MLEGNATMVLESYDYVRGPGHNAILIEGDKTWLVHHYYDARDNGRVVEEGPSAVVSTSPQSATARLLVDASPAFRPAGGETTA